MRTVTVSIPVLEKKDLIAAKNEVKAECVAVGHVVKNHGKLAGYTILVKLSEKLAVLSQKIA